MGTVHHLNGLSLTCFPRLSIRRVMNSEGTVIGAIVGDPVNLSTGEMITKDLFLPSAITGSLSQFIEEHVYSLGGRFLFVLDYEGTQRIYLDACGSMPAVYDSSTGRVASSTGLLLDEQAYRERFDRSLYDHLRIKRDGWFPAGLTAHTGVKRLLANHYLDLSTWDTVRHWPGTRPTAAKSPDDACRQIVQLARTSIDAMRNVGPIAMALTAGHETRMLLASCRDIAHEIDFVTVDHPNGRLDRFRAAELAEAFQLQHRTLPVKLATPSQASEWHARSGHCVGGPNMHSHPTVDSLASTSYFVGGMGGEIGRGFFWRPTDSPDTEIDAMSLANRFGMPTSKKVLQATDLWLQDVPNYGDALLLLDLAYIELRMGPWAFAQPDGTSPTRHSHPLISRGSFEAMLSLPPDWRATNKMIVRSIELHWPELLRFPINRYGDWRDPANLLKNALSKPHLIAKRIRKRFGR
jgi:hypothetical protein